MIDFGDKQFPGVGYPTPVSIPDETTCFLMQIPASPEWWALVVGVLYTLTLDWEWQQFEGGLDREAAAARWTTMLDDAMAVAAVSNECSAMVETPYWDEDSADDANDEETLFTQHWYGLLIPGESGFRWDEQLIFWGLTAFVAAAATPLAAIQFVALSRQFVLAWRSSDLGGIARVFADSAEIARVDTYSATPGVKTLQVALPPPTGGMGASDTGTTLWVALDDATNPHGIEVPQMEVIRKRLWRGEIVSTDTRYNPDCNCIQTTWDDGAHWNDTPQFDPRHSAGYLFSPVGGSDPRCLAAGNMVDRFKRVIDAVILGGALVTVGSSIFDILYVVMPEIGVVIELLYTIAEALIGIGATALAINFTTAIYEQLTCTIYCDIGADGQVSAGQLETIGGDIVTNYDFVVSSAWNLYASLTGEVGLSNSGTVGTSTRDCSGCDCGWCYTWDFVASDGGFAELVIGSNHFGHYVSGTGWVSTLYDDGCANNAYIYMYKDFGAVAEHPVRFTLQFDRVVAYQNGLLQYFEGGVVATRAFSSTDGITWICDLTDTPTDKIEVHFTTCDTPAGYVAIRATMRGGGDNPFGADNC